jgi:hypothetical protein
MVKGWKAPELSKITKSEKIMLISSMIDDVEERRGIFSRSAAN